MQNIDGKIQKHEDSIDPSLEQEEVSEENKKIQFGPKQLIEDEKSPKFDPKKEIKPQKGILKNSDDIDMQDAADECKVFNIQKLRDIDGKYLHNVQHKPEKEEEEAGREIIQPKQEESK